MVRRPEIKLKMMNMLMLFFFLLFPFHLFAQQSKTDSIRWVMIKEGLHFCEYDAPEKSILNDSKLTILKIDPQKFQFKLLSSSEHGKRNRTASDWAEEFKMNIVVNAGMFSLANGRTNKGYMKNYAHYNNSHLNGAYNVMMAMNPKVESEPAFKLFDLTSYRWDSIRSRYHSFSQGMRMIDAQGNPLAWDKRPGQACSMVVCATDTAGTIYFVFTRSPYTHQSVIRFLLGLPLNIRATVYLEGGPEASLYINTGDTIITKFGSYVSKTYENDDNDHFWKIPNVIGIKIKQ
jgi:hypothetical protein